MRLDITPEHVEFLAFLRVSRIVAVRDWHRRCAEHHGGDKRQERDERWGVQP